MQEVQIITDISTITEQQSFSYISIMHAEHGVLNDLTHGEYPLPVASMCIYQYYPIYMLERKLVLIVRP